MIGSSIDSVPPIGFAYRSYAVRMLGVLSRGYVNENVEIAVAKTLTNSRYINSDFITCNLYKIIA